MEGRGRPKHPDILTPREWEVLDLLREDLTNAEIGERIGISERGVKYHVSEIIGKLGVRDRRGAARWKPDAQETVRKAPPWAPIATPWRTIADHLRLVTLIGLPVAGVVAAFVIWGPISFQTDDGSRRAISVPGTPTPKALGSASTSVILFTASPRPAVDELVDAQGKAFTEWLDGGSRILVYDWSGHAFEILGVDAGTADRQYAAFAPQPPGNRRTEWARAIPGGGSVLLQRDDGPPRIYDVASATFRSFVAPPGQNVNFIPSRDGSQLMFNNIVDGRSRVIIADLDGGNPRVLAGSDTESVGFFTDEAVSPDGKNLLMESSAPDNSLQIRYIVTDTSGRTIWGVPVPDIAGGVVTSAQWAGPGRLLVQQTKLGGTLWSKFVDIASGVEVDAPELARQLVSLSPDGKHAIMLLGDSDSPWERRCALVQVDPQTGTTIELAAATAAPGDYQTVFCASVDWTSDGRQAIVSAGGT